MGEKEDLAGAVIEFVDHFIHGPRFDNLQLFPGRQAVLGARVVFGGSIVFNRWRQRGQFGPAASLPTVALRRHSTLNS